MAKIAQGRFQEVGFSHAAQSPELEVRIGLSDHLYRVALGVGTRISHSAPGSHNDHIPLLIFANDYQNHK
jgi:hypothetical protein